jgi:hypothetical protein
MSKEYIKGLGRVEIPLNLAEPDYDFKLGKKRRKIPNPLVELMYPPPKQGLLKKYSLKQLKDAIVDMNDMGLTEVEGFSQLSRPKLVKLILDNPKYFGLPAVKIIGKERTYFNWDDKKQDKQYNEWTELYDPEEEKKKRFEKERKKETRKIQKEKGIPDIGIDEKLFKISPEEQKQYEKEEMKRNKVKELNFNILSTQKEIEDLYNNEETIKNRMKSNENFKSKKALEKGKEKNAELKKDLEKIRKDLFRLKDRENKLKEEKKKL